MKAPWQRARERERERENVERERERERESKQQLRGASGKQTVRKQ